MKTFISIDAQIVIPAAIRRQDGIEPGQEFEIVRLGRGRYRLRRLAPATKHGVVAWLLACPDKGFFVPIESESTDSL